MRTSAATQDRSTDQRLRHLLQALGVVGIERVADAPNPELVTVIDYSGLIAVLEVPAPDPVDER
jgi:hypothetical protein